MLSDNEDNEPTAEEMEAERERELEEEKHSASPPAAAATAAAAAAEKPAIKRKLVKKIASSSEDEDDEPAMESASEAADDQAMEKGSDEPESEGGGDTEPSDADGMSNEDEEEKEKMQKHLAMKAKRKEREKLMRKFMDDEAGEEEEEEQSFLKHLSGKVKKEKEKKRNKKKKAESSDEDDGSHLDSWEEDFVADESDEDLHLGASEAMEKKEREGKKSKKPKVIIAQGSSGDDEEEKTKENKSQKKARQVDDDDLKDMHTLDHAVPGSKKREKPKYPDFANIASNAHAKRNAKIDPGSLHYSPKKPAPKRKAKDGSDNEEERKEGSDGDSAAVKPPAAKRAKKGLARAKMSYQVGDVWECGKKQPKHYKVTFRGEDTPPTGKDAEADPMSYHPKYWTTAELLMESPEDAGKMIGSGILELFVTSPTSKPKKLSDKYAMEGWEKFSQQSRVEMMDYALEADRLNNTKIGMTHDAKPTKMMFFTPLHFKKIRANINTVDGKKNWIPDTIRAEGDMDMSQPLNHDGTPLVKPAAAVQKKAAKKTVANIEKKKEKGCKDVGEMLKQTPVKKEKPAAAVASAGSCSMLDAFGDDADSKLKPSEVIYKSEADIGKFFAGLLGEYLTKRVDKQGKKATASTLTEIMQNFSKGVKEAQKMKTGKEKLDHMKTASGGVDFTAIFMMMPFFSKEAESIVNEQLLNFDE